MSDDPFTIDVTVFDDLTGLVPGHDSAPNGAAVATGEEGTHYRLFDDLVSFAGSVTTNNAMITPNMQAVTSGTTASQITQGFSLEFSPGVAFIDPGSTTTGYAAIVSASIPMFFQPAHPCEFAFRLRQATVISDATNQYECTFGFLNHASATITDGMFFQARHGVTHYEAVCMVGSVETRVETTVVVNTAYHVFHMQYNDGAAYFYIDHVLVATITTNFMPDLTVMYGVAKVRKIAGTTSRTARVDWCYFDVFVIDRGISSVI